MIKRKSNGTRTDNNGLPPLVADNPNFFQQMLRIAAIALVALIVVGIGWFAIKEYQQPSNLSEVPLIQADKSPFKVKPESPGGMEIANQDKQVYDVIAENGGEVPDISLEWDQIPENQETTIQELPDQLPVEKKAETVQLPTPSKKEDVLEVVSQSLQPEKNSVMNTSETTTKKPSQNEASAAPVNKKPTKKAPVSSDSSFDGKFSVQVASYQSHESAEVGFTRLQNKYQPELKGLKSSIRKADLGSKGIFFRLYIGPFNTQTGAENLCKKLASKGQGCIVTRL